MLWQAFLTVEEKASQHRTERTAGARRLAARVDAWTAAGLALSVAVPLVVLYSLRYALHKPFWNDEQWRAYFFSIGPGWWGALHGANAPFPAGWYFLERFAREAVGNYELVLRAPTAIFLAVGCAFLFLLARRYPMPGWAAAVVALAGGLTGQLIAYSTELKSYVMDFGVVMALVYLYLLADGPWSGGSARRRTALRLSCYVGMGLAGVMSLSAIFVLVPLCLLDGYRSLVARSRVRLIGAVTAGAMGLLSLVVFVLRQSVLTTESYWQSYFAPHSGAGALLRFVYTTMRPFFAIGLTDGYNPAVHHSLSAGPLALLHVWTVFVFLGAVLALRSRNGRSLLAAVGGALLLMLIASFSRHWPFGYNRTNLFVTPLLVMLAAVGVVETCRLLLAAPRRYRAATGGSPRPALRVAAAALTLAVAGLGLSVAAVAGEYEGGAYQQLLASQKTHLGWGQEMRPAAAVIERFATPRSAVLVGGAMGIEGLDYYLFYYSWPPSLRSQVIKPDMVLDQRVHGAPEITSFLRAKAPDQVFVYTPFGVSGADLGHDEVRVAAAGYCVRADRWAFAVTALITLLRRPGPGQHCR